MRFSHKIANLTTGRAFSSARNHLRRFIFGWRLPVKLEANAIIDTIDRQGFERIYQRYAVDDPGEDWPKYLDLPHWIDVNIRRIREIELDILISRKRIRILDLGCGAGYFAYIAQLLGHDVVGLDLDYRPMFAESTRLLGVRRVIWRVQPFVPLPDLGDKFDLVTAFLICFNNQKKTNVWGVPEWEFFLDDLSRHLTPRGRVWLELNPEYDGTFYTPELRQFFEHRGAKIENQRVVFSSGLRAPVSASLVGR
jgi:SAM-dependent methyltransferase